MSILIIRRPGESITWLTQPHVRHKQIYSGPGDSKRVDLVVQHHVWYGRRNQLETVVQYIDRPGNYYIEFHVSESDGLITWCNEERLVDHVVGAGREPGLGLNQRLALMGVSADELATMTDPANAGTLIDFEGISMYYEPDCSILIPGPDGLPWSLVADKQLKVVD